MTSRRNRRAAPDPELLAALEHELHQAREPAAAGRKALLGYVAAHPGVTAKEVILGRPAELTYSAAELTLKTLLASGELRADPPGIPFHGWLRLYLASPGRTPRRHRD